MLPLFLMRNNRENLDKCKLCTVRNLKNKTDIITRKKSLPPWYRKNFFCLPPILFSFFK